ncbi:hypothetical protein [Spiroplasma endosymbiont of Virgichneumon dumeticola]|uniref:hypothetical protein n=1 Tax=Spiroplasma endosymbiont of Virgichneumon dumeticola TaxID=3139323 RepID=UPI0035C9133B
MRNRANEEPDCNKVMDKIKVLDIFFEQIILDVILNSPKFVFNNIYGNNQQLIDDAIRKLIAKKYLFTDKSPNDAPNGLVTIIQGNFKGKTLSDVYDWLINEISKRCGLHIPSQKKSAQQSVPESTAVNISTVNYIEQKLWQFNIDTLKFIQLLIRIDKDLLDSKTFEINDEQAIENLTVKLTLFNPVNNQLVGENDNGQQQTTN